MSRNYCFTIFVNDLPYSEDTHVFSESGLEFIKYAVWQLEKCPDTERLHLQGYAEFSKVYTLTGAKKLFHENYQRTVHLEKRKATQAKAIAYCKKEETRVEGPWEHGQPAIRGQRNDIHAVMEMVADNKSYVDISQALPLQAARFGGFIREQIELHRSLQQVRPDITLKPWQQSLVDKLLGPPHPRQIHWYWESIGNTGKTTFTTWLALSYPNQVQVFVGGKHADVAFALDSAKSIFIFDYSRDQYEFLNYGLLEQVKNGRVWSGKYQSQLKCFPVPHVLVFSNQEPDRRKMSADRWDTNHILALEFEQRNNQ